MLAATVSSAQEPARLAQLVIDHEGDTSVRGFHGSGSPSRVRRSFQSDSEARAELDRILKAVGLNWIGDRIALRASAETANAEAGIGNKGDRYIFYNATFMQKLKERTAEQWALVSVLAHELGHHVAFHTELDGNDHKFELEADYFSGFVLRRLGATLDQSHAAMRAISPKEATKTHPGLDQRLQVITIGWTDGGGQGAPRGLKERAPDQPSPPAAVGPSDAPQSLNASGAADVVRVCREVESMTSLSMLAVLERQHAGKPAADCISARIGELKAAQTAAKAVAEATSKADAERQRLAMLQQQDVETKRAEAEAARKRAEAAIPTQPGQVFRDCPECPEMVVVPAGNFMMGSPGSEEGRQADEGPQRQVTIARPFAVGRYEVTFAEWDACVADGGCTYKPADEGWGRGRRPVMNVSWNYAQEYVRWIRSKTGAPYRLLSEPEWEYAARAGTTTAFSFGETIKTTQAQFSEGKVGSAQKTVEVGTFKPNAFGLFDMHGNVWEWVEDCYAASYANAPTDDSQAPDKKDCFRVLRGGSRFGNPGNLRSASRSAAPPVYRSGSGGFRLARTLNPTP